MRKMETMITTTLLAVLSLATVGTGVPIPSQGLIGFGQPPTSSSYRELVRFD
jgi:hypothetical protein